jgi:hypothetical protein
LGDAAVDIREARHHQEVDTGALSFLKNQQGVVYERRSDGPTESFVLLSLVRRFVWVRFFSKASTVSNRAICTLSSSSRVLTLGDLIGMSSQRTQSLKAHFNTTTLLRGDTIPKGTFSSEPAKPLRSVDDDALFSEDDETHALLVRFRFAG